MHEYIVSSLWILAWPFVIWISYLFTRLNINQLKRMEELEGKKS